MRVNLRTQVGGGMTVEEDRQSVTRPDRVLGPLPASMAEMVLEWRIGIENAIYGGDWVERAWITFTKREEQPVLAMVAVPLDPDGREIATRNATLIFPFGSVVPDVDIQEAISPGTDQRVWVRDVIGVENADAGYMRAWVESGNDLDGAFAAELDRRGVEPEEIEVDSPGIAGDTLTAEEAYSRPFNTGAHPSTKRNAAGTANLARFRVDAVVYAPSRERAELLLEQANIYLEAAALEPEHDAPITVEEIIGMLERLQGRSWPGSVDAQVREVRGALTLLGASLLSEKARRAVAA
jgi:hypothetical protein